MLLKSFKQLFRKPLKPKGSAWDASGSGRRLLHFQPESGSINNLLSQSLEHLRSRSRDMVRKNSYAANIIDTIVSNSVGTGIKPQSKAKDGEFRKKIQELWLRWTDEADSSGASDFYGLQALVCRSMIEGGECFVRLRTRKREDGLCVPLQLQVLESEHLDNKSNQTLANGNVIRNGIEFNRLGQREAYYLFREHPGEGSFGESVRVPANDVLHIYRPLRPGQIRGVPWLSSVLLKLYELDQYDDAELVRKKTAAMFAAFITRLDPEANILGEGEANEQGVALSGLEPGTILLDIDSPGGEVNGLFDLSDFIYEARALKKIVAITNDDAYSAAYAIASSAEKVYVSRTSGVGSIGVIASHIDQSGFDEKQGIKYTTVFAGSRKNDLNPHEPITSESLESLQEEVDRLYEMFVQLIARNRNLSTERIKSTEAGLYFGERAIEIGLADEVITYSEFINNHRSRSFSMTKEQAIDIDDLIEQGRCLGYESCRTEVLEVIRLCNLSKMPEKIGEFIEQGVNAKQVQEILMSILAERTKKTEILSTIPQSSSEDLMMQVAKARQNSQSYTAEQ